MQISTQINRWRLLLRWLGLVSLIVAGMVVAPAIQASAAVPDDVSESGAKGLVVGRFDAEVAAKNGYELVVLPDGRHTSARHDVAEAVRQGRVAPTGPVLRPAGSMGTQGYDAEDGECGVSWVRLVALGSGGLADLGTGFSVRLDWPGIWDINWRVNITDSAGSSQQGGYDAPFGVNTWSAPPRILDLALGWANAGVPWYSYVILTNGFVCYSLGPSTPELIY